MSNYHRYLTNMGYLLRLDRLSPEEIQQAKKELTFEPLVLKAFKSMVKPSKFTTYKLSPNYIFVPRFYGINTFGRPLKTAVPPGDSMNTECQIVAPYAPRSHQQTAYQLSREQLLNNGGGILSVFCGWGKTFMAIYLATELHGKTLILVHKEDLVQQWTDEISTFTGGKAKIGIIQQNKVDIEGCDFVLAMIPSLSKRDYSRDLFSSFRLLIVDECHHVGSEVFSRALDKVCFRYTLGLSATPDRKDGLTRVFTNYLGPIFHIEKRKNRDDTLVLRQPLTSHSCYYAEQYFPNGTKNTGKMVLQLSEFAERNQFVMMLLRLIYSEEYTPEPRQTLVLSKSRKHLTTFYQFLEAMPIFYKSNDLTKCRPITFGYYWGHNPNGENGTTDYCLAAIPKLVQRRKRLQFDLTTRQRCIFTAKSGSCWCTYHQYLDETEPIQASSVPHINEFTLCSSPNCVNYFIPSSNPDVLSITNTTKSTSTPTSTVPRTCPTCRSTCRSLLRDKPMQMENQSTMATQGADELLETLKEANKKKSTKDRHREMLNESRKCDIILGTNDICSEAFSCSTLNTLICLTPQQDVEQTVGRILRKQDEDNLNRPLIIDLIDKCGNFVNHSRVRNKIYGNEGFRVVNLPSLELDNNPEGNFNQELFHHHVYQQSFGGSIVNTTNTVMVSEVDNDEENEESKEPTEVKCYL